MAPSCLQRNTALTLGEISFLVEELHLHFFHLPGAGKNFSWTATLPHHQFPRVPPKQIEVQHTGKPSQFPPLPQTLHLPALVHCDNISAQLVLLEEKLPQLRTFSIYNRLFWELGVSVRYLGLRQSLQLLGIHVLQFTLKQLTSFFSVPQLSWHFFQLRVWSA